MPEDDGALSVWWGNLQLGILQDIDAPFTTIVMTTDGDWSDTIIGVDPKRRIRYALIQLINKYNRRDPD